MRKLVYWVLLHYRLLFHVSLCSKIISETVIRHTKLSTKIVVLEGWTPFQWLQISSVYWRFLQEYTYNSESSKKTACPTLSLCHQFSTSLPATRVHSKFESTKFYVDIMITGSPVWKVHLFILFSSNILIIPRIRKVHVWILFNLLEFFIQFANISIT